MDKNKIKAAIDIGWEAHFNLDHVGSGRYVPCDDDCVDKIKARILDEVSLIMIGMGM